MAERTRKERLEQQEYQKRQKHEAMLEKSLRPSLISVPDRPFRLESTRRFEISQQKLEDKRMEEEREAKRIALSFRARKHKIFSQQQPKRKVTVHVSKERRQSPVFHPLALRFAMLHEESVARKSLLRQLEQAEEEAKGNAFRGSLF